MRWMILAAALLAAGCTAGNEARRVLAQQGYTDIEVTGYRFLGCGNGDDFHTGFLATHPVSKARISGVVCSGWWKSATVRFD